MSYSPTVWVNGTTPDINATNLNHLETGLQTAAAVGDAAAVTATAALAAVTALYDSTLSGDAASFDVTSLSQAYSHLRIIIQARTDRATATEEIALRINNDSTAANYNVQYVAESGSSNGTSADTLVASAGTVATIPVGTVAAASAVAGRAGSCTIDIANYTGTTFHKTALFFSSVYPSNTNTSSAATNEYGGGVWLSTAAITRLTFTPRNGGTVFKTGSRLTVYGLL